MAEAPVLGATVGGHPPPQLGFRTAQQALSMLPVASEDAICARGAGVCACLCIGVGVG